jgi:hypothetical protein
MQVNLQTKFKFYTDPGHGWLAVKADEIKTLGIQDRISLYSYTKGQTVYLEEDCDASLFITEYRKVMGKDPEYDFKHTDKRSPIRSYNRYGAKAQ